MEWEETGSKKLCLAVHNSQQLTDIRHAAKSQGMLLTTGICGTVASGNSPHPCRIIASVHQQGLSDVYAGVPTYIINDERATGSPESIVLVIGPAAGGTIDGIVGDLKILD